MSTPFKLTVLIRLRENYFECTVGGYKHISKALNIPSSSVEPIIKK